MASATETKAPSGMTPATIAETAQEIEIAKNKAAASHAASPNSYLAGYDAGYVAGMVRCFLLLTGAA